MIIKVMQEDIFSGLKGDCDSCPIALAMSRAFSCMISVNGNDYRSRAGRKYHFLPIIVQNFISHFDREDAVEPFEFEVKDEL